MVIYGRFERVGVCDGSDGGEKDVPVSAWMNKSANRFDSWILQVDSSDDSDNDARYSSAVFAGVSYRYRGYRYDQLYSLMPHSIWYPDQKVIYIYIYIK